MESRGGDNCNTRAEGGWDGVSVICVANEMYCNLCFGFARVVPCVGTTGVPLSLHLIQQTITTTAAPVAASNRVGKSNEPLKQQPFIQSWCVEQFLVLVRHGGVLVDT